MSEQDKQVAKEHAERAATQAKHAAKNSGRAAKVAAKIAAEEAGDVVEKVNERAEEAVEEVSKRSLRFVFSPMGKSVVGFTVAIGAAIYATHQSTKTIRRYPYGSASTAASRAAAKANQHRPAK